MPRIKRKGKELKSEIIDGIQAEFLEEHHNYIAYKQTNQNIIGRRRRETDSQDHDQTTDIREHWSQQADIH